MDADSDLLYHTLKGLKRSFGPEPALVGKLGARAFFAGRSISLMIGTTMLEMFVKGERVLPNN